MSRFDPPEQTTHLSPPLRFAIYLAAGLAALFITSFILFAAILPNPPSANAAKDIPKADGIVVFTGTALERIETGLELLRKEKGERLLISGLYNHQDFQLLENIAPAVYKRIKCCIDLDYHASNTKENATETRKWAEVHKMRSLIIVSSAHHIPRARLEMRRAAPTLHLSTYAVAPANVHFDAWWRYSGTFKLLLGEYLRYSWALLGLPN